MVFKTFIASFALTICLISSQGQAQGIEPGASHSIQWPLEGGGKKAGRVQKFMPINENTLGVLLKVGKADKFLFLGFFEVKPMHDFIETLKGATRKTYTINRTLDDNTINDLEDSDLERETAAVFGNLGFRPSENNFHMVISTEVNDPKGAPIESTAETDTRLQDLFLNLAEPEVSEARQ